jgi:putative transcriptional regulator
MSVKMKIRDLRLEKNLTQRQVADTLGMTESNYRKLENTRVKSISFDTIDTLCKIFTCTPGDIFEVIEDDPISKT